MTDSTDPIVIPLATLTVRYGLTAAGEERITESWQAPGSGDPGAVPMITRLGLLGMSQQSATAEALELGPWSPDDTTTDTDEDDLP